MSNSLAVEKFCFKISENKYDEFCVKIGEKFTNIVDLTIFKETFFCDYVNQLCSDIFRDEIANILVAVNDPLISIAVLDVPESTICEPALNTIYGAAIVMGIFNKIGKPNIDSINKLPFAVHTASHDNARQLDERGLDQYTPEVKLGFHNDGLLSEEGLEIPNHIVVYNLYINYRQPGNFIWAPTASWAEAAKFGNISENENIRVNIRLTPSFYFDEAGDVKNSVADYVQTPLSHFNEKGEQRYFLNGQVDVENNKPEHVEFVQSIRSSLEKNPKNIYISQKERRALFLKNTHGFHAREVFQDPIEGVDLTRVFIRIVDLNSEKYFTY